MQGLHLVLLSGTHEKLQFAAMTASVAAVCGRPVTVFLSMNALKFFLKTPCGPPPADGPFGEAMTGKKIPQFATLFEQSVELGDAEVYACSMAMDVLDVHEADLAPIVKGPMGLTKFLSDAEGGQMVVF